MNKDLKAPSFSMTEYKVTYATGVDTNGVRCITCFECGRTSFHPQDVEHKYCAFCHVFHRAEQEWNPRYLAYCRSQGVLNPDDMLKIDLQRYPGGVMCGFVLWNSYRILDWKAEENWPAEVWDYSPYDAWLMKKFPAVPIS